jgi:hypothetical protein
VAISLDVPAVQADPFVLQPCLSDGGAQLYANTRGDHRQQILCCMTHRHAQIGIDRAREIEAFVVAVHKRGGGHEIREQLLAAAPRLWAGQPVSE